MFADEDLPGAVYEESRITGCSRRVLSLAPDLLTPFRYEDYRDGIDPALDAIAERIQGPQKSTRSE